MGVRGNTMGNGEMYDLSSVPQRGDVRHGKAGSRSPWPELGARFDEPRARPESTEVANSLHGPRDNDGPGMHLRIVDTAHLALVI